MISASSENLVSIVQLFPRFVIHLFVFVHPLVNFLEKPESKVGPSSTQFKLKCSFSCHIEGKNINHVGAHLRWV